MSRSYHKTPNCSVRNKYAKRWAKRKARRSDDILQHKAYRKLYDSWDIVDYKEIGKTFDEYYSYLNRRAKHFGVEPPNIEEARKDYDKIYRRK